MWSKGWLWALVFAVAAAVAMPVWAAFPATVEPTQSHSSKGKTATATDKDKDKADKDKGDKDKKEKDKKEQAEKEKREQAAKEKRERDQATAKAKAAAAREKTEKPANTEKPATPRTAAGGASAGAKGKCVGGLASEAKEELVIDRGDKEGATWKVWSSEGWSARKASRKVSDSIKAGALSEEDVKALRGRAEALAKLAETLSPSTGATEEQRKTIRAGLDGVATEAFGAGAEARPKLVAALDAKLAKGDMTPVQEQELCAQAARVLKLKAALGSAAALGGADREKAAAEFDSLIANLFE